MNIRLLNSKYFEGVNSTSFWLLVLRFNNYTIIVLFCHNSLLKFTSENTVK